jgi:hypothetical protein
MHTTIASTGSLLATGLLVNLNWVFLSTYIAMQIAKSPTAWNYLQRVQSVSDTLAVLRVDRLPQSDELIDVIPPVMCDLGD